MNELKLQKSELIARDGTPVRLVYDPEADILEIFFGENGPATGIELTDQMVLRIDQKQKRALSLMFLHFSILSEQTEYGPRSFAIDTLERLPEELRELVFRLLTTLPVRQFLKLSQFQLSPHEQRPLAYVESQPAAVYA
ncbi:MAG: DUF2283 domain-containing protein [Caldilineaceae bacterium]|nr:DUF2283 domain-containing protein [Caldilineaceae bacterium]